MKTTPTSPSASSCRQYIDATPKRSGGGEHTELYNHPLSGRVITCAIEVHKSLGPGLLETAYEQCLAFELRAAGIAFKIQHPMPVRYKGVLLDCGFRLDFFVEDFLVVELKAVQTISPVHEAQLLTYMTLAEGRIGLLLNFNVKLLKHCIQKFVL